MTSLAETSALGLAAAAVWGAGDFSGGVAARHLRVTWLVSVSHGFSLVSLGLLILLFQPALPGAATCGWGLAAGISGGIALLTFYRALSLGDMGTTAAISGLLTAAIPVTFTLFTIGPPDGRQIAGFGVALAAIWLISGSGASGIELPNAHRQAQRKKLAVISGVGFGVFLVAIRQANAGGLLWPLAIARVGSCSLALGTGLLLDRSGLKARPELEAGHSDRRASLKIGLAIALLAGALDTSGNLLFIAATRAGRLDVAAVLSSLYPASTILLAAWLLRERPARRQAIGMATALIAVALIS